MRGPLTSLAGGLVAAVVLILTPSTTVHAQAAIDRAIVVESAPITLLPDASRAPLRVAAKGTNLVILTDEGDWIQVRFQDPQFGPRVGYIQKKFVSIQSAALAPLDLSVPTAPPAASGTGQQPGSVPAGQNPQRTIPNAVTAAPPNRVFIDLNWMNSHPLQKAQTFTYSEIRFEEQATAQATYPELPRVNGWDVSGGVLLGGQWAVGVRAFSEEFRLPVGLGVSAPHPILFNRFATDADVTDSRLLREEKIFDFHAMYFHNTPRWRIVGFGGPSYFRVSHEMVQDVVYSQFFSFLTGANIVDITAFDREDVTGSAWGLNVGADAAYFFSRFVGIGGGVRFNYGTVKINEPLSESEGDLRVGTTTFVAGPRFRF